MQQFPAPYAVDVALSRRSHHRLAGRGDAAWLADAWADPGSRVVVLAAGRFALDEGGAGVAWLPTGAAPEGQRLLLGAADDGVVRFAVVPPDRAAPEGWTDLRTAAPFLPATDLGLLVHAQALAEWLRSHRFCPRCAGRLVVAAGGAQQRCEGCGRLQFPRSDPAVIMLVTDGDRALLGRQPTWPAGRYSTLAGFVDPGESLEQAVVREVQEEAGVEVGEVTYFGSQPWPFPSSLMVGFFARAVTTEITVDAEEIEAARWFTREDLRSETAAGSLVLPGGISISRSLVEAWYGATLPGQW